MGTPQYMAPEQFEGNPGPLPKIRRPLSSRCGFRRTQGRWTTKLLWKSGSNSQSASSLIAAPWEMIVPAQRLELAGGGVSRESQSWTRRNL